VGGWFATTTTSAAAADSVRCHAGCRTVPLAFVVIVVWFSRRFAHEMDGVTVRPIMSRKNWLPIAMPSTFSTLVPMQLQQVSVSHTSSENQEAFLFSSLHYK